MKSHSMLCSHPVTVHMPYHFKHILYVGLEPEKYEGPVGYYQSTFYTAVSAVFIHIF